MKNILVISNMYPDLKHPSYGIFVKRFCDSLQRLNIEFEKSVMKQRKDAFNKSLGYIFFYINTFNRLLKNKYNIIYVHFPSHSYLPVWIVNSINKKRIFVNVHGTDTIPITIPQKIMNIWTKKSFCDSEKIIVPSEFFKNKIAKYYKINKDKIYVYPSGGINTRVFYPANSILKKKIKDKFKFDNDKCIFTFAGRIEESKGWDYYVKAIDKCLCRNDSIFVLAGSGSCDARVDDLIKKYHLENIIVRMPMLDEKKLKRLLQVSDYYINASTLNESLGLTVLESMACATPVISTNYGAPRDFLKNDINSIVIDISKKDALSEGINKAFEIKNTRAYDYISKRALETALEFGIDKADEILKDIITQ